jgi:hypothetical protein
MSLKIKYELGVPSWAPPSLHRKPVLGVNEDGDEVTLDLDKLFAGRLLIQGPSGSGKAQPYYSPILTPSGWITMGALRLGDEVIASDGKPTKVIGIHEQGVKDILRVNFEDHSHVDCDPEHLWEVVYRSHNQDRSEIQYARHLGVKTRNGKTGPGNWFSVKNVDAIRFKYQRVPLDPYVYGVVLGDGYLSPHAGCSITVDARDAEEMYLRVKKALPDTKLREVKTTPTVKHMYIRRSHVKWIGQIKSREKFIDKRYLYNSIGVRKDLLAGLLDTDGSVSLNSAGTHCKIGFSTTSYRLAEGIRELVLGLGGLASISEMKRGGELAVSIRTPFNPLLRKRKAEKWRSASFHFRRKIISVEPQGKAKCRCITIDHPDHLYVTKDYILTHNSTLLRRLIHESAPHVNWILIDPEGEHTSMPPGVWDLSEYPREQQLIQLTDFIQGLINSPREQWKTMMLVIIDECELFTPQDTSAFDDPSVGKRSRSALVDLMSRGRKRGLCGIVATHRLAQLSASVRSEARNLLIGGCSSDVDIHRAADLLGWGRSKAFAILPKLSAGQFVAFGQTFEPKQQCIVQVYQS